MPDKIEFDNTEIAFESQTDAELKRSYWLFKSLSYPSLVQLGPFFVGNAVRWRFPITTRLVKATFVRQFCGGESLRDSLETANELERSGIGTMLDYAVEGRESEKEFGKTTAEVSSIIGLAAKDTSKRSSVVKLTGLARFALLEKVSSGRNLNKRENREWERARDRVDRLCGEAAQAGVSIYVDAEESWIQEAVDGLAFEMMAKYNREKALVFNTVQTYRWDRLGFLEKTRDDAKERKYIAGVKLVRGAYLEKEREWASKRGVKSAVHASKEDTDRDYDQALRFIVNNIDHFALCAATHNEASTKLLLDMMDEGGFGRNDPRFIFSQLYGMGNHLTYNLAHHDYNALKYVPYGPVRFMIPYLVRRAQENSSISGTTSRELTLVSKELLRRGLRI